MELETGKTYLFFKVKFRDGKNDRNIGTNMGKYLVVDRNSYEYKVVFCGTPAEDVEVLTSVSMADLISGYVVAFPALDGGVGTADIPHV